MESRRSMRRAPVSLAAMVLALVLAVPAVAAAGMKPATTLTVHPAKLSHPFRHARVATPKAPKHVAINRPAMSMEAYKAAKARADQQHSLKPQRAPVDSLRGPSAPSANGRQGINQAQAGGFFPSDVNGANGLSYNVLTTNVHYTVYKKGTSTILKDTTLNSFFGYGTEQMFDPRVVYDASWGRWVTEADAFEESGTTQILGLAASQGHNPAGPIWDYLINAKGICGNDVFVDYPQISTTQDAILLTVNCFRNSDGAFLGAAAIGLPKAVIYNGQGFSVPVFRYFAGTLTPPNVVDGNPRAHMLLAGSTVNDVTFQDPQGGFYASIPSNNPISGWVTPSVPPSAGQPGCTQTSCRVDTSDGRFVSPSTQYGDSLWNVATYNNGGFAMPRWGDFDTEGTGAETTKQSGVRFLDGCSDDYNASLVSGPDERMFMNWSASDGRVCGTTKISNVLAARKSTDAAGTLPVLINAFTSSAVLTGDFDPNFGLQRWGDTSQITRVPGLASRTFTWNQIVADANNWGTWTAAFNNP